MKVTKNTYIKGFLVIVAILAIVRFVFPNVAKTKSIANSTGNSIGSTDNVSDLSGVDSVPSDKIDKEIRVANDSETKKRPSIFFNSDGSLTKHRIFSVPNFGIAFPDQQDVQLDVASKIGVQPVKNRDAAARLKDKLVYVGSNPYFYIDNLHSSIPYLVPRAAILLQDIGHSFFDSLQIKGIPLHKLMVTSVMRSQDDVTKLRSHNGNATRNSCHMYGTTFDVSYNRYKTVETIDEPKRKVRNDTLKWVLSEVLRDMRQNNRCFIKYEVHQGCFHITVK